MPLLVSNAEPFITLVTIDNQPKRNAMPRQMLAEMADLWDRLATDRACRAVVVTGAGEKAFCAGADIGGDLTADPDTAISHQQGPAQDPRLPEAHHSSRQWRLRRRRRRTAAGNRHSRRCSLRSIWPARGALRDLSLRRRRHQTDPADWPRPRHGPDHDRPSRRRRGSLSTRSRQRGRRARLGPRLGHRQGAPDLPPIAPRPCRPSRPRSPRPSPITPAPGRPWTSSSATASAPATTSRKASQRFLKSAFRSIDGARHRARIAIAVPASEVPPPLPAGPGS